MGGMEASLVSGILNIVGNNLAPLVIKEFSSMAGVTKDLQELQDLVEEINNWLQTVGDKAMRNDRSSNWLRKLKDAAYDAEDLVHEFHIEAEKHEENVVGVKNVIVKHFWTKPKSVVFEFKTAHKIKAIKKRFDEIVKGRSCYSTIANSIPVDRPAQHISKTIGEVPHWTIVDETSIFGRDKEKNWVISKLTESSIQQNIKIISVIGLGGSGKTTLAKLVFNDGNTIKQHFELILWVHVSREFDVEKLVEKLYEAIPGDKPNHLPLQHVSRTISDKLTGKKFLVVMDDVWTEDHTHWEQFMVHLKSGAPGSSILLTTRSRKVAEAVDSTYTFDMPFLSEDDSWKVFEQNLGSAAIGLDPEFVQVGTEIVKKCSGVPLAIKVLAGVLRGMKGIEEWQSIRDSNLLDVEDKESKVFACLSLSYFHLPRHLKQCFIHCSIFPRGYVITRRLLISQWIAHGFIPTNQAQQPEDVGIGYFDSLLKVGFLQDQDEDHFQLGRDKVTCKMHDLVHDLSRKILQDEFVSKIETIDQTKKCRYLSLTSCSGMVDRKLYDKVRAFYVSRCKLASKKTMKKQCCIRSVILKYINIDSLPLFVSNFEYMGYLEISNVDCEALPDAISHCWNLQALHVINCTRLANLPESIGKVKKLRTLELDCAWNVRSLPQSIGDCDNLGSLYIHRCDIKDMPNSIEKLENLRVLSVVCCTDLRQLLPSEPFGKLRNLRTITLTDCWALEHLPQCITLLGHLQYLDLSSCTKLRELPEGIGALKKLEVLNLERCKRLRGLPAGCGQLIRVQQLGLFVIGDRTKHARISELEKLDKLNGELQIKNIKHVKDPFDAEMVHLKRKNGIRKLSLDWSSRWEKKLSVEERTEEELLNMKNDLDLLNNLEPPLEIEELTVIGYRGLQLPRWMTKQWDSCDLKYMHMLKQSNPPQFCQLTKLVLVNLPNLEHLWGLADLPRIKTLELREMPKLIELLTTTTGLENREEEDQVQCCFPDLSTLVISDCPRLIVKPYFPDSLKNLTLEGSHEQLLSSGCFFHPHHAAHGHGNESSSSSCIVDVKYPHLTELKLGRLIGSSSGWEMLRHLTELRTLEISECRDLRYLPESMRSLTCLHRLAIDRCKNLCVLPEWLGELQSLQDLRFENLPIITSIAPQSIQRLTCLQVLHIMSCHALQQLPEQLGELCSLRALHLCDLPGVTCLPESMQRLASLQYLILVHCDALTHLPEWLGELSALQMFSIHGCSGLTSLPQSIQRLTGLWALCIRCCPTLVRRCKEGVGEDWHLVSHIPDLLLRDN